MVDRDKNYTGISDKERVSLVLRVAPTFLRYENEIDNKYTIKILFKKKFPAPAGIEPMTFQLTWKVVG